MDGVGYVGGALAAFGAGIISDLFGWSAVFQILSAIAMVSVLCCLQMTRISSSSKDRESI